MKCSSALFLLFLSFSTANALSQQPDLTAAVEGYVTRAVSPTDFDANGLRILSNDKTKFSSATTGRRGDSTVVDKPYLGETVSIYGKLDKSKHQVRATEIIFRTPTVQEVRGTAVIDRILSTGNPNELLVRADGYPILINAATKTAFQTPVASLSGVTTNVWLKYHGKSQPDGIILADNATFAPNIVLDGEAKLLDKNDYDPAAVPPSSKQSSTSKFFLGLNPKKIPPYEDSVMQARVERVGASLIPAYQRALPDSDHTKILFQFQLVDASKWRDAITLPTGIILVPRQVVDRMQNDSQLATVLADNIATALEKQTYRTLPSQQAIAAANLAGLAGGFFVPGLGIATGIATASSQKAIQTNLLNQSGRVSLCLLHDAGYDIDQAPIAWWLLSAKPPKDVTNAPLPDRAAYLYNSIGRTWKTYPEVATPSAADVQTK